MNVVLPKYEPPPEYIAPSMRKGHPNYDNRLTMFMPRLIYIKKSSLEESLGFNIRGGVHSYSTNIFVSKVYPGSLAYKHGLKEADQLISVNGVDFRTINHFEAVRLLKESLEYLIVAKYSIYDYRRAMPLSNENTIKYE